jgi:hypothetical protein
VRGPAPAADTPGRGIQHMVNGCCDVWLLKQQLLTQPPRPSCSWMFEAPRSTYN